ncbi:ABC transporter ATP-binding protein [Flavobacteriaceae bacterium GSB9]|nr:ABC transporter ATP-binding protein [Flavobacteriaceae bacterium GSB9]
MTAEIDNVELYFKEKRILSGIYLKAETGKVTAILGSNGSGKSCLLNIIFGSLIPKYKLIRLNGKPVLRPLYQKKLAAYLPQNHFTPQNLRVIEAFKLFNVSWDSFTKTFKHFEAYKNYKFKTLSGGERRLVETYIILKMQRNLILLDEPFSHLAPLYIEKLNQIIKEEKKHKAIIVTDHMYSQLIDISDDIYLLKNGNSKQINNIKELEYYKYLNAGTLT